MADNQDVHQTASRRNTNTINNPGGDPRAANLVRPISIHTSNNPIIFSGYGQGSILSRPADRGFRPQGSGNNQMYQQQGVYAPAAHRPGGYGPTGNNSGQRRYSPNNLKDNHHMSLADVFGTDMNEIHPAKLSSAQQTQNSVAPNVSKKYVHHY